MKTQPLQIVRSTLSKLMNTHAPVSQNKFLDFCRLASLAGRFLFKTRAGARLLPAAALAVLVTALAPLSAAAATIAWGPATTISGDTDVAINGTSIYAYSGGNAGATVNGVAFAAGNSGTAWGANVTLTTFGSTYSAFGGGTSSPWSILTANYQTVLQGGAYGGASAGTVQLNNLIVGHSYAVQIWVNDSRSGITGRSETTGGTGNAVTLTYNSNTQGSLGQYSIGNFVADATTQTFTLTPSASGSVQLNAISVLDRSGDTAIWTGATDASWGTPGNWGQAYVPFTGEPVIFNASSTAHQATTLDTSYTIGTLTLSNAPSAVSIGVPNDGSTLTVNSGITLKGASPSQNLTIGDAVVLGASQTWTVTNNGTLTVTSSGISDNGANYGLTITGNGTVDLQAAATYTGNTTISGGKLIVDNNGSLTSTNITVATSATLALGGNGSFSAAFPNPTIFLAGGATFDASAATTPSFSGTVTNTSNGGLLSGSIDYSSATISMLYDGVHAPFIQTNGTLTLGSSTVVKVNNPGAVLPVGTYTLITAAQTGTHGAVGGSLPNVNLTGNGAVGAASLQLDGNNDLQLVVAAPDEWTGTSDNSWANAGNWTPANVPNPLDWILFDTLSTSHLNTVLNQDFVATGLSIVNPSGPVIIGGGNNLEIGAGGINMNNATADLTITAPLTVPSSANWNIAVGRTLNINGGVTASSSSGPTIVGAGTVNINSAMANQGTMTVASGSTLKMTSPNVLSSAASSTLAINGVLDLSGQMETIDALSGSGIVDNTAVGAVTLTNNYANGNTVFNGIIQNTGGPLALQVNGGNFALNSSGNTYSGGTTFTTNNNGSASTLYFPSATATLGTGPVTFNPGSGTYTYSCTFTNALNLNNCWLRMGGGGYPTADSQTWSGPVTVTGGFQMSGDNQGCTLTLSGPMNFGAGGLSVTNSGGNGPQQGYAVSIYGDALTGPISGSGGVAYYLSGANSRLTVQGANTYSGATVVNADPASPGGKLSVWGAASPFSTGTVTLNAGAIIEAAPGSGTVTNALVLNGGILESEPQYNNYNQLFWNGPITMTADSALVQNGARNSGIGNDDQSSGVVVNGSLNVGGFTLAVYGNHNFYGGNTISGPISGSGLIIVSNNVLQLNGANTYTGTFRAAGGTIGVGNANAMQQATLDMNAADSGAVNFSQNSSIGGLIGTRNLANAGYTFTIGNNNANNTSYSGTLSGSGGVIKTGSSIQTFAAATSYSGNTIVAAGTLSFSQPSLALLSTVSVSNGAVLNLNFNATNAVTALVLNGVNEPRGVYNSLNSGGLISGSGAIVVGASPEIWTGAFSSLWSTNVLPLPKNWTNNGVKFDYVDGLAVVFDDSLTANSTVDITNGNVTPAQVTFSNNVANYTFQGSNGIAGSCALFKNGSGSVTLNTSNTYTGPTAISGGTLTIGAALDAGSYGGAITNNGTLNITSPQAQTLSGIISGTGAINDSDSGGMTLSGANTFSGGFNMLPGAANLGAGVTSVNGLSKQFGAGPVTITSSGPGVYEGLYMVATLTYTNSLTANGAYLRIGGGNTHTLTWAGPVTLLDNGLEMGGDGGAGQIIITGNITVNSPTSIITTYAGQSFGATITGGISGNGSTLTLDNPGAGLTLAGPVSGTINLYADAGAVTLSSANTFSGSLRSGAGTVTISSPLALQNATLDMNPADAGTVTFSQASTIGALMDNNNLATSYILSIGNNNASTTYGGVLSGSGGLNKIGTGTLTLSGANTYGGGTIVSSGDLVLSGGSIVTTNIAVAGGATLDVSAAASTPTLVGSSTLANTSVGAVLSGAINASVGTLSLVYDGVHPSIIQSNGTLTVSSATVVTVRNVGPTLAQGSYTIISGVLGGSVAGSPLTQSVAVTGSGAVGLASLQVVGNNLNLVIGSPLAWSGGSGTSWNVGGDWTSASVPANGAVVNFNASSTANLATVLNANFNLGALNVLNPSGPVSIGGAANTLTLTNGISLASATKSLSITAPVVLGASQSWTVTNNQTLSVTGGVSGGGALTVTGGGTVSLGGVNSYSGATIVNGGNVSLNGAISASSIIVTNGGVFNETATGVISGGGTFLQYSPTTSTLAGPNSFSGSITVSAGEVDISNWNTASIQGGSTMGGPTVGNTPNTATLGIFGGTLLLGGNTFVIGSGTSPAYKGIVNQTGGTLAYTGGTATLLGNGDGSVGIYNLSGGTFTTGNYSSASRGIMMGVNNNCTGIFNLSGTGVINMPFAELAVGRNDASVWGGTAVYTQSGGSANVGYLSIGGASTCAGTTATFAITNGTFVAGTIQNLAGNPASSATLYLGGGAQVTLPAFPASAGTANITLDFTNGFLSPLATSASYMPAGTFTHAYLTTNGLNFNVPSATGANSITVGQALINAPSQAGTLTKTGGGVLVLSGTNTYSGATTISAGELLGGTGGSCSNSAVTVAANASNGVLLQSANTSWFCPTLNYSAGSTYADFNFNNLAPSTTTAPLQVGALNFTSTPTVILRGITAATNGVYPLISYTSLSGTPPTAFTSGDALGTISNNAAQKILYIVITNGNSYYGNPLLWAVGSANWDIGTTVNWKTNTGTANQLYFDPAAVILDDTASGTTPITVTLNTTVNPASVTANLTNKNYTIGGTGSIGSLYSSTTLTKNGTGTLTLTGTENYTGATTINAGTVTISGTGNLGSGTYLGAIANAGTFNYNSSSSQVLGGVISGAGTLTQSGPGQVILTNVNTYTGPTVISGGTLTVGGLNGKLNSGSYAGAISIANGSILEISNVLAGQTLSGQITGQGGVTFDAAAAIGDTLSCTTNTYSGVTTIANGSRLSMGVASGLSPNTTVNILGNTTVGGQWFLANATAVPNNMTISGVGYADAYINFGAIRSAGNTFSGVITIGGNARFGGYNGAGGTITGQITGSGGYYIEFVNGDGGNNSSGTYTLANTGTANNYNGNTLVSTLDYNSAAQAYTGCSTILKLGANEQIPNGAGDGLLDLNGANANHLSIFELNGFNETVNGLTNASAAGAIIRNTSTGASTLTIGDGNTTSAYNGVISDGGAGKTLAITKIGTGTLTLGGADTYIGATAINGGTLLVNNATGSATGTGGVNINNNGTLAGTGIISGAVNNNSGGVLQPGVSGSGTLTLNGTVTLASGSASTFAVNGSTLANTSVALGGSVTYGGVLTIVPSGTFTTGQQFQLFSGAGATNTGNFASIAGSPGAGKVFSFTNGVLSVVTASVGPGGPAHLTNSVSGSTLSLSWPAGQGWRLQMQTNSLSVGLSTNWSYLTDGTLSSTNITIDSSKPTVFYRLAYP